MLGIYFTNVFFACRYLKDSKAEFKEVMRELATCLMYNDARADADAERLSPDSAEGAGPSGVGISPRSRAKTTSSSACCDGHKLMPIRMLDGYKGGRQQRCLECGEACSWCCATCSTETEIYPLHPPLCGKGRTARRFNCFAKHKKMPARYQPVVVRRPTSLGKRRARDA